MNYNFDTEINRCGSNSHKWDLRSDIPSDTLAMWVADMDFRAAEPIIDTLRKRVDFGVFGYSFVPDRYYAAIIQWFEKRHNWNIASQQIIYTSGVVPAISAIIHALAKSKEKVLILTPVYNCFFSSIRNQGCFSLQCPLKLIDGSYVIDYSLLEEMASDPDCHLMIMCNPHNPVGRVWTKEELMQVDDICRRHEVLIVSDEIHCEIVFSPNVYTPFGTIAQGDWISCISPTKAFNIAGLQIANIVCSNPELKQKVDRAINDFEICDVNPFGVDALIAAYDYSGDWLDQLLPYIYDNYLLLKSTFETELPSLPIVRLEGTYLAWIDCRAIKMSSKDLEEYLIQNAHVWLNCGSMYGEDGEGFLRMNLGCQRSRVREALHRLVPIFKSLLN